MHKTVLTSWPLFFGVAMIMAGSGLQSTLLGVRGTAEGFSTSSIGVIMAMYYVGYMIGSHFTPMLLRGVGHIRVFAALASIASVTALLHGLFPLEGVWAGVRLLTGLAYAGLYICIESWLNAAADNRNRGQIMAVYLVILYGSIAAGQYLLAFADPKGMELFALTSVLVTCAVLPISLSSRPAPTFDSPTKAGLRDLFKSSPLGVYGLFISGAGGACLLSIGPVYAAGQGFTLTQISTFMAVTVIGGVLFQFPVGWLSDRFDRRKVLIGVAALTALACLLAPMLAQVSLYALFFAMFLIGGFGLTIYGLSSAHTNDHLTPAQMVAASATMILINGAGSVLGPIVSTNLMTIDSRMLFVTMAGFFGSLALYGLYRTLRRAPVPRDRQGHYPAQSTISPALLMNIADQKDENRSNR